METSEIGKMTNPKVDEGFMLVYYNNKVIGDSCFIIQVPHLKMCVWEVCSKYLLALTTATIIQIQGVKIWILKSIQL